MYILAQLIGCVTMLFLFISYQVNERRKMVFLQICISICCILQYALLGAYSGVAINIVCLTRNILFYYRGKYKWADHVILPGIISAAEVILTVLVWKGSADILALIGAPLQTAAVWMKQPKYIRILMLIASPLWLIYDVHYKFYVGVLTECIVMSSILIGMLRHDKIKK